MGVMICSAKVAMKKMEHINDDDLVVLAVLNKKSMLHNQTKQIKKRSGEELIDRADVIEYQDNDFFGRFSLYGISKEDIHSILFPQLE